MKQHLKHSVEKQQVDEMPIMKKLVDKILSWQNVMITKYPVNEKSNVTKRQVGETASWQNNLAPGFSWLPQTEACHQF